MPILLLPVPANIFIAAVYFQQIFCIHELAQGISIHYSASMENEIPPKVFHLITTILFYRTYKINFLLKILIVLQFYRP